MSRPLDTSAEDDRVQIDAYRRLGGPGRLATVFRLNALARQASLAGIRSRHPHYNEEEMHLAYARLVLGDETVREVWPDHDLVDP